MSAPAPCYRIVIPNTGHVIEAVEVFARAKARAEWHRNRLAHPTYPAQVIVQRVGPDGRARKVWPPREVTA
jgi:hypothetical protein